MIFTCVASPAVAPAAAFTNKFPFKVFPKINWYKRLRKQISYSDIDDKIDHLFQGIIEAFEREDNEAEEDINNEDEGDVSLLFIGSDDGSSEVDEDEDDDDDSLPDLIPAEEDSDWEDEGIADCDWFIDMNSLVVLLHRFGLGENLHWIFTKLLI